MAYEENYARKTPGVKDDIDPKKHWEVIDKITHHDTGEVEERHYFNTVVDDCSKLIACLMKAQAGYTGLLFWAIGSGSETWNDASLPSPTTADHTLLAETYRKAITADSVVFLDASNVVTATPTNKLQISINFDSTEANNSYFREFGLFGGNATITLNSGIMINRKIHTSIYKTSSISVARTLRLTF